MFTYVKLNNYRSLNNIIFDLRETKDKVKKIAAIYGENGSGKSNLVRSFYFLGRLLYSFEIEKNNIKFAEFFKDNDDSNLSSFFNEFMKNESLASIYKNSRTIDCDDNTKIEFGFVIDGHEGNYTIEFNDAIVYERLYYYTGKQSGTIFEIDKNNIKEPKLASSIFKSNKIKKEFKDLIEKYWGKHSMLAITLDALNRLNEEYVKENVDGYLYDFHHMINETSVNLLKRNAENNIQSSKKLNFVSDLENGDVSIENEWLLDNTEKIINDFFTQTYSDIKKVFFDKKKEDKRIKYNLMFYKNINGKVRLVPVEQESTGTRRILGTLRNLFGAFCGCTVIIDEVDNGVHDLLLKVVIDSMKDFITGQLIFTTHNTSLLESLDPKMVYIINSNYDGTKEIVCLSDYKLKDHNNARDRYMKGLYGGIPFVESVDYYEIINNLKNCGEKENK